MQEVQETYYGPQVVIWRCLELWFYAHFGISIEVTSLKINPLSIKVDLDYGEESAPIKN